MTLEGDTLIQIQKLWDTILAAFFQYLSTNKICTEEKKIKEEHHNISSFLLPPDTHVKLDTEK